MSKKIKNFAIGFTCLFASIIPLASISFANKDEQILANKNILQKNKEENIQNIKENYELKINNRENKNQINHMKIYEDISELNRATESPILSLEEIDKILKMDFDLGKDLYPKLGFDFMRDLSKSESLIKNIKNEIQNEWFKKSEVPSRQKQKLGEKINVGTKFIDEIVKELPNVQLAPAEEIRWSHKYFHSSDKINSFFQRIEKLKEYHTMKDISFLQVDNIYNELSYITNKYSSTLNNLYYIAPLLKTLGVIRSGASYSGPIYEKGFYFRGKGLDNEIEEAINQLVKLGFIKEDVEWPRECAIKAVFFLIPSCMERGWRINWEFIGQYDNVLTTTVNFFNEIINQLEFTLNYLEKIRL